MDELAEVAAVVDVLQTPAFLCRQTDFIRAAASAGKPSSSHLATVRLSPRSTATPKSTGLGNAAHAADAAKLQATQTTVKIRFNPTTTNLRGD